MPPYAVNAHTNNFLFPHVKQRQLYCRSAKRTTVIRTLDFAPNIEGWNAARELLARIHSMDTQRAVVAMTKVEHGNLFRELGWWDAGSVGFGGVRAVVGEGGYGVRVFVRVGEDGDG